MKRIIVSLAVLLASAGSIRAEDKVIWSKGSVDFLVPVINSSLTYLYDFVGARNLLGAETAFVRVKSFYGVVGLAADVSDGNAGESFKQIPYLGIHTPALASFLNETITIGAFAGRDFNRGDTVAGVKASMKLW